MLLFWASSPAKTVWEPCPLGHDSEQKTGTQCFLILAWQRDKSSSTNSTLNLLDGKMQLGLQNNSADKIILQSCKWLVHSSCSLRIRKFALLWLARCWSSSLHISPPSKDRSEVSYKDKQRGGEHLGFFLHVAVLMLWERGGECNYWAPSLLNFSNSGSTTCQGRMGQMCGYIARARKRVFKDQAAQLQNSAEKFDTDTGEIKVLPHLTSRYCH